MDSTMMRTPLSVNHLLERAGKFYPQQQIVSRRPDKSLHRTRYADIHRRARQLAQALVGAGVARGEAVGTLLWNHYGHLECYFGIPAAGAVLHTLNLRLSPEDLAYIVADAGDRLVIVDDVLLPLWQKVLPLLTTPPRTIVLPFTGQPVAAGWDSYEEFIAADATAYAYPEQDENEAMGMCYTSGTTGRPKGVVYSHRSMVLHAITNCLPDCLALSAHDSVLAVTPMFHANSWAMPFSATMVGAKQVLPGPHLGADDLLELMQDEEVSLALGVPTIWMMILQALEAAKRPWRLKPHMRMMVGGAAVPQSLIAGFDKFDLHIKHGWGMTELSPVGTLAWLKPEHEALPLAAQQQIRARQGIALPLVELRIVDEAGREQSWDGTTVGELQARGPWVTGAYHGLPADPGSFSADGWLRTGDVASIDREGYMKIADRSKDLIKSGGEWISSVDLENAVMGHPAVAEAAVIAVKHPKWDERPLAVVVLKPGKSVAAAELRAHLAKSFAKWQLPDDYAFVEVLPRTSTGKFQKTKLREQFKDFVSLTPS